MYSEVQSLIVLIKFIKTVHVSVVTTVMLLYATVILLYAVYTRIPLEISSNGLNSYLKVTCQMVDQECYHYIDHTISSLV